MSKDEKSLNDQLFAAVTYDDVAPSAQSSDDALTPKEYKFSKGSKVYQILMNSDPATIARKLSKAFQNKNTDVYLDGNEIFQKKIDGDVHMPYFSIEKIIDECSPELVQKIAKISEKIDYKNKPSLSNIADKVKNFFTIVFSLGLSGVKDKDITTILDEFKPEPVNLGSIGKNELSNYKSKAEGMIGDITGIPNRFKQVELNAIKNYFASDMEKVLAITESLYATLKLLPEGLRPLSKALRSEQLESFTAAIKDNADAVAKLLPKNKKEGLKKSTEGIIEFLETEPKQNFLKDLKIDKQQQDQIKEAAKTTVQSLTNELTTLKKQAINIDKITGPLQDFQTAIRKNLNNKLGSNQEKPKLKQDGIRQK
jgi:hypothetical protein